MRVSLPRDNEFSNWFTQTVYIINSLSLIDERGHFPDAQEELNETGPENLMKQLEPRIRCYSEQMMHE